MKVLGTRDRSRSAKRIRGLPGGGFHTEVPAALGSLDLGEGLGTHDRVSCLSWKATHWAKLQKYGKSGDPLSVPEKFVLLVVSDYVHPKTGEAWLSMAALAEDCLMTERGARKVVRRLEAHGLLTSVVGGGRARVSVYRVPFEAVEETRNGVPGMDSESPERGNHGAPKGGTTGSLSTVKGERARSPEGVKQVRSREEHRGEGAQGAPLMPSLSIPFPKHGPPPEVEILERWRIDLDRMGIRIPRASARDRGMLRRMIGDFGAEEVERRWKVYLEGHGRWWWERSGTPTHPQVFLTPLKFQECEKPPRSRQGEGGLEGYHGPTSF